MTPRIRADGPGTLPDEATSSFSSGALARMSFVGSLGPGARPLSTWRRPGRGRPSAVRGPAAPEG